MAANKSDLLQGTLDLLILRTLSLEPLHGYGVSQRLEQLTRGVFSVNAGTFFPALYRLEEQGLLAAKWGRSENNRRARFYSLTRAGEKRLEAETRNWETVATAIGRVLRATEA
ncbi:MAG TPA: PadR family transcriptional regulator [Gemmatimonadales bacterium]|nr:PadR family transcriptional regulator [Gemmatimonadales bacterium]